MANLEDVNQNINITVNEKGVAETTSDIDKLNDTIDQSSKSSKKDSDEKKKAETALKSFKTQLREANAELQKQIQLTGETSVETRRAAQAVAELRDQMEFARDIADSFNPDQKFKALGAATQLAGTGLQGVTAGMALFGDTSEETEEVLLKVQSAMAFSDALQDLSNLGDQWDIFKSVVQNAYARIVAARQADLATTAQQTIAQRLLNATMLLNPYVLIGAAVAAVTIGLYAWISATNAEAKALELATAAVSKSKVATDDLAESIEETGKATEGYNTLEVARAKALGATDKEIQKIIQSQKELEVQTSRTFASDAYKNVLKATEAARIARATLNKDLIKDAQDNQENAEQIYKKANDAFNAAIISEAENRLNTIASNNQKELDEAKKLADEKKKLAEEAYKTEQELIRMRGEQARAAYEKELKDFEIFKSQLIDAKIQGELDEAERLTEVLNGITEEEDRRLLEDAENKRRIDEYKLEQKKVIEDKAADIGKSAFQVAGQLAGKNKGLQKAAIIGESAVGIGRTVQGVFTGNAAALAQGIAQAGPIAGPPLAAPAIVLNSVQGALSVAGNIAATTKALSALGGGGAPSAGASTGGASAGGGTNGGATRNVAQVGFQASPENQITSALAKANQNQPPIQAFVVSQAVTDQQELDRKKELQNSF